MRPHTGSKYFDPRDFTADSGDCGSIGQKAFRDTLAFIYAKQVTMRNFLFIYVIKITYVGFTRPTLLVGRLYII